MAAARPQRHCYRVDKWMTSYRAALAVRCRPRHNRQRNHRQRCVIRGSSGFQEGRSPAVVAGAGCSSGHRAGEHFTRRPRRTVAGQRRRPVGAATLAPARVGRSQTPDRHHSASHAAGRCRLQRQLNAVTGTDIPTMNRLELFPASPAAQGRPAPRVSAAASMCPWKLQLESARRPGRR